MPGDVDAVGLVASLILIVVALLLSRWNRLGLKTSIITAVLRATIQLLGIGVVLVFIIDEDRSLILSWLWVVAMALFAARVLSLRAPEVPGLGQIGLVAFGTTLTINLTGSEGVGTWRITL